MGFYQGKRVFVTGGSAGIGLSTALQLARAGANVVIAARRERPLAAALEQMRAAAPPGARHAAIPLNVASTDSVQRGVTQALAALGGIDIIINNAGHALPGYIDRQSEADHEAMLQVNYLGAARVIRAFLPVLLGQRAGVIANVASMLGFMGAFGYAGYAASKYALCGYTECLRQDLLPFGISVHLCYPPTTRTPGLDKENESKPPETWAIEGKSRAFSPDHVARALLRGIERKRFHILVGADSALIWRLQRWAPWLVRRVTDRVLVRYLAKHDTRRLPSDGRE